MFKNNNKYNELLHWLAYNFPGIYRMWTDKENNDQFLKTTITKKWQSNK